MSRPERGATYAICPDDRYSSLLLAFTTLKERGYPVGLELVSKREALYHAAKMRETWTLPVTPADEKRREAREARFARWVRLTVHNPDFVEMCHPFWESLERTEDDHIAATLEDHPGHLLVQAVDTGDTAGIANYKRRLEEGLTPRTTREFNIPELLPAAFLAAVQRKLTPGIAPEMRLLEDGDLLQSFYEGVEKRDRRAYVALTAQGVKPISTEAMGGLTQDYYSVVEEVLPDFAAFASKPGPPNPPIVGPDYVY